MKDFAAEIRASMDVENFLHQAHLILDMGENNMDSIIDRLLNHIVEQEDNPTGIVEEAKKSLFTHDSGKPDASFLSLMCWVLFFSPFHLAYPTAQDSCTVPGVCTLTFDHRIGLG